MRRRARIDGNQPDMVDFLRQAGASVEARLARLGDGIPDLLVGLDGMTHLVEVKQAKGHLRDKQESWHARWRGGPVVTLYSLEDAAAWLRAQRGR